MSPSPLVRIVHPIVDKLRLAWFVKRDDLYALSPGSPYQGNKVRKLKGLFSSLEVSDLRKDLPLISFGGAFSNHLAALAAAGQQFRRPTIGIVRGEEVANPVLQFCRSAGMELYFVSREKYRQKNMPQEQAAYQKQFGPGMLIPEGGSGDHVYAGTKQLIEEITSQLKDTPTYFQLAAGTGGTAAGCILALRESQTALEVYPVLKGGWMAAAIQQQLGAHQAKNWNVIDGYHFGGYAKRPKDLLEFCKCFHRDTGIPIEPMYTGKLFFGVLDRIKRGFYPPGSTLVTYHSGGMAFVK